MRQHPHTCVPTCTNHLPNALNVHVSTCTCTYIHVCIPTKVILNVNNAQLQQQLSFRSEHNYHTDRRTTMNYCVHVATICMLLKCTCRYMHVYVCMSVQCCVQMVLSAMYLIKGHVLQITSFKLSLD